MTTGFFPKAGIQNNSQETTLHFIDVGIDPDKGTGLGKDDSFDAWAVTLIDNFKSQTVVTEAPFKIILESFFSSYPKYKAQLPYLTPTERMDALSRTLRASEMVACMDRILRKLVAHEIYQNPLLYKEVFDNFTSSTPNDFLYQATAAIPAHIVARSLIKILSCRATLFFTEYGKELRERKVFTNPGGNLCNLELTVQVQGKKLFPGVRNKAYFAYVGQLPVNLPEAVNSEQTHVESADILALIKADNAHLLQDYLQQRQNLLSIADDDLITSILMDLYIEFLPIADGAVPNATAFFSKLMHSTKNPTSTQPLSIANQQLKELLASSLAAGISTKQIKEVDKLFACIENISNQRLKTAT
jgi:hypothetical protein